MYTSYLFAPYAYGFICTLILISHVDAAPVEVTTTICGNRLGHKILSQGSITR
jgi:hypothetical protein